MDHRLGRCEGFSMTERKTITRALALLGALGAAAFIGCAPEPQTVACSNDAQCHAADERLTYCLESRCVECVGAASCKSGEVCDNGACVECVSDRGCSGGASCVDGECKRM
jgi:hypothetical protein